MSTFGVTVFGQDIPAAAPRTQGMTDQQAANIVNAAQALRAEVLHCHYDLSDRDITVYAANAPDGPVAFTFGDGTADVSEESLEGQATATHTYTRDGNFTVGVYTDQERWTTDISVNWPEPMPTPPPPETP